MFLWCFTMQVVTCNSPYAACGRSKRILENPKNPEILQNALIGVDPWRGFKGWSLVLNF